MRVFVAGATGVIGQALVTRLRADDHDVLGSTRSPEGAAILLERGAMPVIAGNCQQAVW